MYYLGPDKGGSRAYKLLSAALTKTGQSAIARYAARGKQYLVLIRPMGEGLAMEQLHYADELKPFAEVPLGDAEVKETELALALQLIEQAKTDKFEPEKYTDDVRARMLDLMQALKASLAKSGQGDLDGERKPAKSAARKTAKKKTRKVGGSRA